MHFYIIFCHYWISLKKSKTAEMESNYFFGDGERSEKGAILTSLTTYNHTSSTGFVI